jgi:hypothetical protein
MGALCAHPTALCHPNSSKLSSFDQTATALFARMVNARSVVSSFAGLAIMLVATVTPAWAMCFRIRDGKTVHAQWKHCESTVKVSRNLKQKARLRKDPGLYFDNIPTSPSTVSGAFPSHRLLTSTYARRPSLTACPSSAPPLVWSAVIPPQSCYTVSARFSRLPRTLIPKLGCLLAQKFLQGAYSSR